VREQRECALEVLCATFDLRGLEECARNERAPARGIGRASELDEGSLTIPT
jgi:hypothetical protein